nr:hypothetical protein [uncultured Desulfobacter sp.]
MIGFVIVDVAMNIEFGLGFFYPFLQGGNPQDSGWQASSIKAFFKKSQKPPWCCSFLEGAWLTVQLNLRDTPAVWAVFYLTPGLLG